MNMDFYRDALDHRNLSEELHRTPWWDSLMHNDQFKNALQRNGHMRVQLADTSYLKKLLRSEQERQSFIEQVFHPAPEHLAAPDED
ncbi:hypothetical protein [Tumebacillus flagellatus]|uniref:Uncharacterized protein n=1 Tax=Tumebacillus flagellatus TaxID=1157490 RepID=A0A074LQV5_9BACL|nr:hypothetical protein [Tumebacillus flagellatus]KEO83479.1 hypothetical protein EL26_09690 [Tumebacillus flagellatus]